MSSSPPSAPTTLNELPPSSPYREMGKEGGTIFVSQVNAAKQVVELFPVFDRKFQDINLLIVLPTNRILKQEIMNDLSYFLSDSGLVPITSLQNYVTSSVIYNAALLNHETSETKFMKHWNEDYQKGNKLHIIIRDECHAESRKDSNWVKFVKDVILPKKTERTALLFLLVSSTPHLLTAVTRFNVVNIDPTSPTLPFYSPRYRGLEHSIVSVATEPVASLQAFFHEYTTALDHLVRRTIPTVQSLAYEALCQLIPPDRDPTTLTYVERDVRNKMICIRIKESAQQMKAFCDGMIYWRDKLVGNRTCSLLEIIAFPVDDMSRGLSKSAQIYLNDRLVTETSLQALNDLPCIVVFLDAFEYGSRFPDNMTTLDLRCGLPPQFSTTTADFDFVGCFHDLGCLAGHHAESRRVFLPYTYPNTLPVALATHRLHLSPNKMLSKNDHAKPLTSHPEHTYQLFSRMRPHSVVLTGPPQCGKSGVCMAVLELLYARYVPTKAITPPSSSRKQAAARRRTKAVDINAADAAAADSADMEKRASALKAKEHRVLRELSQLNNDDDDAHSLHHHYNRSLYKQMFVERSETFVKYHDAMRQVLHDSGLRKYSMHAVDSMLYNWFYDHLNTTRWNIADVGCGMYGVIHQMNDMLFTRRRLARHCDIVVTGFDVSDRITSCIARATLHAKLRFNTVIGDIFEAPAVPSEDDDHAFDIIIFNRSIWASPFNKYLEWSLSRLTKKTNGVVVVAMPKSSDTASLLRDGIELGDDKLLPVPGYTYAYNEVDIIFLQREQHLQ